MFIGRFGAYVRYVNTEEREDVHSTLSNWSWGLILDDVALCLPLRWKFPGCNGWRWSSRCPKWRLLALQGQAVLIKSLGSISPMICKGAVLHFPNERQPTIALATPAPAASPRTARTATKHVEKPVVQVRERQMQVPTPTVKEEIVEIPKVQAKTDCNSSKTSKSYLTFAAVKPSIDSLSL